MTVFQLNVISYFCVYMYILDIFLNQIVCNYMYFFTDEEPLVGNAELNYYYY